MFNILRYKSEGISDSSTIKIDYNNSDFSTFRGGSYLWNGGVAIDISKIYGGWDSLKYGDELFRYIENLQTVDASFPELTTATFMFESCFGLQSVNMSAPQLETMFMTFWDATSLETVDMYVPNVYATSRLYSGVWIGAFCNCSSLRSFRGDLGKASDCHGMFDGCYSLEEFDSATPSLLYGQDMFNSCILNAKSVMHIVNSISEVESGTITIGIGIANNDEMKQAFAKECGCSSWDDLNQEFLDKNWTVQWQYNGPATMSLRGGNISHKVFVKAEEVEDSKYCKYIAEDGSKCYSVSWYNDSNTSNDGYTQYDSLEEALQQLGIIKK